MQVNLDISTIIAILSIIGTAITAVLFFGKLKWENAHHADEIKDIKKDVNNLGSKCNAIKDLLVSEQRELMLKIEALDKIMIEMSTTLKFVQSTIVDIKDKMHP